MTKHEFDQRASQLFARHDALVRRKNERIVVVVKRDMPSSRQDINLLHVISYITTRTSLFCFIRSTGIRFPSITSPFRSIFFTTF